MKRYVYVLKREISYYPIKHRDQISVHVISTHTTFEKAKAYLEQHVERRIKEQYEPVNLISAGGIVNNSLMLPLWSATLGNERRTRMIEFTIHRHILK